MAANIVATRNDKVIDHAIHRFNEAHNGLPHTDSVYEAGTGGPFALAGQIEQMASGREQVQTLYDRYSRVAQSLEPTSSQV